MKKIILLISIILYSTGIVSQENETTTYYLIRHAEKVRTDQTNKNPDLTEQGTSRAKNWSVVFENVDFDLIYATKYNRTIQTAAPTALKEQLEIQYYTPTNLYNTDFKAKTNGKTVLIVGHSNTTPQFVNDILEKHVYEAIKDNNNDNLYIVTINGTIKNSILLKIPHSK